MFKSFLAEYNGQLKDGLQEGTLSCAFFVSSILTLWGAIDQPHATVKSTIEAMKKAGWQELSSGEALRPGDVILWEKILVEPDDPEPNAHVGFYIGDNQAVSNSSKVKEVIEHDYQFKENGGRKIQAIYRGKHLMPDINKEV